MADEFLQSFGRTSFEDLVRFNLPRQQQQLVQPKAASRQPAEPKGFPPPRLLAAADDAVAAASSQPPAPKPMPTPKPAPSSAPSSVPSAVPSSAPSSAPSKQEKDWQAVAPKHQRAVDEEAEEIRDLKRRLHNSQRGGRNRTYYEVMKRFGPEAAAKFWVSKPKTGAAGPATQQSQQEQHHGGSSSSSVAEPSFNPQATSSSSSGASGSLGQVAPGATVKAGIPPCPVWPTPPWVVREMSEQ